MNQNTFSFRFSVLSFAYEWSCIEVWLDNMLLRKIVASESLIGLLGLRLNSNFVLNYCR